MVVIYRDGAESDYASLKECADRFGELDKKLQKTTDLLLQPLLSNLSNMTSKIVQENAWRKYMKEVRKKFESIPPNRPI